METVYEVVESDETVEVCVTLTMPETDILDNSVNVEVFVDDDSIHIPSNATRASELKKLLLLFFFLCKFML